MSWKIVPFLRISISKAMKGAMAGAGTDEKGKEEDSDNDKDEKDCTLSTTLTK